MNTNMNMADTNLVAADAALAVWLQMWNTDTAIARRICSADFRIHFLISESDGSNPGDDVPHGRMLWNLHAGEVVAGGIDIFDFTEDGLIREVWSVNGTRAHVA